MKSRSFNIFQIKEKIKKITAKFQSTKRVPIEDAKRFLSSEKFRDFRETGPSSLKLMIVCCTEVSQLSDLQGKLLIITIITDKKQSAVYLHIYVGSKLHVKSVVK